MCLYGQIQCAIPYGLAEKRGLRDDRRAKLIKSSVKCWALCNPPNYFNFLWKKYKTFSYVLPPAFPISLDLYVLLKHVLFFFPLVTALAASVFGQKYKAKLGGPLCLWSWIRCYSPKLMASAFCDLMCLPRALYSASSSVIGSIVLMT